MKDILIVQLARFGDILQTLPTIQGLKRKYPDCEISLLVRSTFAEAAKLSPFVDRVIEMPTKDILGPYFESRTQDSKARTLAKLIQWTMTDLKLKKYDLVINLTYSKASSLLTQLVPAKERRGFFRSRDYELAVKDPWSQYFAAQVLNKNLNILHLNDLFARVAGVEDCCYPIQLGATPVVRNKPAPQREKKYIGIQTGASSQSKTLDLATWKAVCEELAASCPNHHLVFFGSSTEKDLINSIIPKNAISLAGEFRFQENLRWVRACEWIVTPDTAMVHLASLAETKIINISLGGVRAQETGPYGDDHSVLVPKSARSGDYVDAIVAIMQGKRVSSKFTHYKTVLRKCTNDSVRCELVIQVSRQAAGRDSGVDEIRNFFEQSYYLLSEFRCSGRVEDIPIPELRDSTEKNNVERLLHTFDAMCALKKIGKMGQQFAVDLILHSNDLRSMRKLSKDLEELDRLMGDLHASCEFARPLIDWARTTRDLIDCSSDAKTRFEELAMAHEAAYRELEQNVDILEQLLQTAVKAAQNKSAGSSKKARRMLDAE